MRKLQRQERRSNITRKILSFALVTGLTLLPACRTPNPNQFKDKAPMVDTMQKQEKRKIDLKSVPKKKQEEKKEEPKKKMKFEREEPLPAKPYLKPLGPTEPDLVEQSY